jgi:BirA family biotin operon repressor/biotin-[acetyl-CoA-carboxylase] ligase
MAFSNAPGFSFIELQSVDSTNNYALAQIHAGLAHHGMAFFAHEQTRGKGQRGKQWLTDKSANIILSLVLSPPALAVSSQFQLSACIAVATHRFFSRYAGDETAIKWPNDIYWRDRKAGGILIENIMTGDKWTWAVAGIGININQTQFPAELPNPVSLKQITGKQHDTVMLARELCADIAGLSSNLPANDFTALLKIYNQYLYRINRKTKLRKGSRVFEALIKGVTPSGELVANHGIDETFAFGQVEWLLPQAQ